MASHQTRLKEALALADHCVKCGLCLPECPTYRLYSNESESPRGRIALIEGLAHGKLHDTGPLRGHLAHCLLCRRCEAVCPSQVEFGRLMDLARSTAPRQRTPISQIPRYPRFNRLLQRLARSLPSLGHSQLATLQRIAQASDLQPGPSPGTYPATKGPRGNVGLHLGCVTRSNQGTALRAAISLLNHCGFSVDVPADQVCCGAIERHQGRPESANRLIDTNRQAFGLQLDAIVSISSGCTVELREQLQDFPFVDIAAFLHAQGNLKVDDFLPTHQHIRLHHPCSLRNTLRTENATEALLRLVPGLHVELLGSANHCCGAAGDHLVSQPQQARRLRTDLLAPLQDDPAATILTSNVGCALHLAEGLYPNTSVMHVIEFLADRLASPNTEQ